MPLPRLPLWLLVPLSLMVALATVRYLAPGAVPPPLQAHLDVRPIAFATHLAGGAAALGLGALQLIPRLRRGAWHRWIGRATVLAMLVGGASGLQLAIGAAGGPVAGWGFGALSMLWVGCAILGARHARAGRVASHRRWMLRAFALSFAAVTLRLQLPPLLATGLPYETASQIVAWTCWLPNLVLLELWLRTRTPAADPSPPPGHPA